MFACSISSVRYNYPMHNLPHRNRRSMRLPGYDYTLAGGYFVTLLSYQRIPRFGEITEGEILLSPVGELLQREWLKLPCRFPNIVLDFYVIMPDHMHGILLFNDSDAPPHVDSGAFRNFSEDAKSPQLPHVAHGSLGAVIRSFKSTVSRLSNFQRSSDGQPLWQRNYYEHVIRNEADLDRIRNYILSNPLNWPKEGNA
jgi:putative transposase